MNKTSRQVAVFSVQGSRPEFILSAKNEVDPTRLELVASAMRGRRSPN